MLPHYRQLYPSHQLVPETGLWAEVELAMDWLRAQERARARDPLAEPELRSGTAPEVKAAILNDFRSCVSLSRPDGCADLGVRYETGMDGLRTSPEKSVVLYERGCAHESGIACNNLGVAFGRGAGVDADPVAARRWLEKACSLDAGRGCGNLALLLSLGEGGTVDLARSNQVLARGCALDDAISCHLLGSRHAGGSQGLDKDAFTARELWQKACELGHTDSCGRLDEGK